MIKGKSPGTVYFFKVLASNLSGQSALSAPVSGFLGIGPDPISDLSAEMNSSESISLTWTAPADADGSTSAMSSYEIRFSKYEITGGAWNGAEVWDRSPAPSSPGNTESVTITGLDSDTTYYFAIKSIDAKGFLSDVSNSASSKTSSLLSLVRHLLMS